MCVQKQQQFHPAFHLDRSNIFSGEYLPWPVGLLVESVGWLVGWLCVFYQSIATSLFVCLCLCVSVSTSFSLVPAENGKRTFFLSSFSVYPNSSAKVSDALANGARQIAIKKLSGTSNTTASSSRSTR